MEQRRPVMMYWMEWYHLQECPACHGIGHFTEVPGKDYGWLYWAIAIVTLPVWVFFPGIPFVLLFVRLAMKSFPLGCVCNHCKQFIIFKHSSGKD